MVMTNAGLLSNFSGIFASPAMVDGAALAASDNLDQLRHRVNEYNAEAASWRAGVVAALSQLRADDDFGLSDNDAAQATLATTLEEVEEQLKALATPLLAMPGVALSVDRLSGLSSGSGKLVRKLLRRIERIRVAQHAAHVDLYYGLLALQ
jgi:hypothetical protein